MKDLEYAILPWFDQISAGRIVSVLVMLLIGYCLFEAVFKKFNCSMRRGTLSLIGNTIWPVLINAGIFTLAYWQWAFPLAIIVGGLFIIIMRYELKESYQDELEGYRGLNKEIRKLRAEAFADLSIEEQKEFKQKVKPQKFYWWIFWPAVVILPFLLVLLLEQLGAGDYLFKVVYYVQK